MIKCTQAERDFLDRLYKEEPELLPSNEGIDNFPGYYTHWNVIIKRCAECGVEGYSECPTELIVRLANQKYDADKDLALLEAECRAGRRNLGRNFGKLTLTQLISASDALKYAEAWCATDAAIPRMKG